MTAVAYGPLTAAEQVFKDLIWDPLVKAGEVYIDGLQASIPVLDWPIVQGIEKDAIGVITDAIFRQLALTVDLGAIQLVNAEAQSVYDASSEQLVVVATEQGVNSDAYRKALQAELQALAAFGHLAGN